MSTKQEELKKINVAKKAMAEQAKALREELNATKDERKAAKKAKTESRKIVRDSKGTLRNLLGTTGNILKDGDSAAVKELSDKIMESSTALVGALGKVASSLEELEEL